MKRLAGVFLLLAAALLLVSCGPIYKFPRTGTGYRANHYRLGRTLGASKVHVTLGVQDMGYVDDEGNGERIVSLTGSNATALSSDFSVGVTGSTDLGIGIGFGFYNPWEHSSKALSLFAQQQLTPKGNPFALSVEPCVNFIWGQPNDELAPPTSLTPSAHSESMDAKLTTVELRIPMSYHEDRWVEFLWSAGLGYYEHRALYSIPSGAQRLNRAWISPIGSLGVRVGAFTFEGTGFSNDGDGTVTFGMGFRFGSRTPRND